MGRRDHTSLSVRWRQAPFARGLCRAPRRTMCDMEPEKTAKTGEPFRPLRPGRVGVRELRQNLSVCLARVVAGDRLEVTGRGHPVAMLVPIRPGATLVERLVAEGRAIPAARDPRTLADLPSFHEPLPADLWERLRRAPALNSLPAHLDSSALLELVLPERERAALESAIAPWPDRLTGELSAVECVRAVRRQPEAATLLPRLAGVLSSVTLIRFDGTLLRLAAILEPPRLGSLDAIHLASALSIGDHPAAFITCDERLAEAARALGPWPLRPLSPSGGLRRSGAGKCRPRCGPARTRPPRHSGQSAPGARSGRPRPAPGRGR